MNRPRLATSDLQALIRTTAARYVDDVSDLEVQALYSTFRTTIGLRAVRLANEALRENKTLRVDRFRSKGGLDFDLLSRETIVQQLEAGSGLDLDTCAHIVGGIEDATISSLKPGDSLVIEGIGTVRRGLDNAVTLELDDALRAEASPPLRALAVGT